MLKHILSLITAFSFSYVNLYLKENLQVNQYINLMTI